MSQRPTTSFKFSTKRIQQKVYDFLWDGICICIVAFTQLCHFFFEIRVASLHQAVHPCRDQIDPMQWLNWYHLSSLQQIWLERREGRFWCDYVIYKPDQDTQSIILCGRDSVNHLDISTHFVLVNHNNGFTQYLQLDYLCLVWQR